MSTEGTYLNPIDLEDPFERLQREVSQASTGGYNADVKAALTLLISQIEVARRAVKIAERRYKIARADEERVRAERELAELEAES